MNDAPERIVHNGTEYVRADVLAEAVELLEALEGTLKELWGERHSHQDRASFERYFAHEFAALASARAFLSRQPEPSGLPQHAPHPAGGAEGIE